MNKIVRQLALGILYFSAIFWQLAGAASIEAVVTGTIEDLIDPADKLGYGGAAIGRKATIHFIYDTDTSAIDWYGGARFPREADYFTYGDSNSAPSWVSSYIVFDNGATFSPDDYEGAAVTTDQVKVIERNAGSPYDYIGFADAKYDVVDGSFVGGDVGAVIFEYVENLVNGISIRQFPEWIGDASDYPTTRGRFTFENGTQGWMFSGRLVIDSLRIVADPESGMLIGIADEELVPVGEDDTDAIYRIDKSTGVAEFLTPIGEIGCPIFCGNAALPGLAYLKGELYASNVFPDNTAKIGKINLDTGEFSPIANQSGPNWSGLAADEALGLLYTVDRNNNDVLTAISLTGQITTIGTGTGIDGTGLAFDNTDRILYATDGGNQFRPEGFHTIDVKTGVSTRIGSTGLNPVGHFGLAFDDASGDLYGNDFRGLFSFDTATGFATYIGDNVIEPQGNSITGLAWVPIPSTAVSIDIKPGSDPNSINPSGRQKISVAILTTDDFDAQLVDPLSLEFGPASATETHARAHIKDVDGDGDLDMLLHFKTQETGIACGDTEATLTGETFDGQAISGTDAIVTVKCP